jgi:phosphohistidine phosphatase
MRVYFLRHAKATFDNWDKPDDERPLNPKGKKQMKRVGRALDRLKLKPAVILSSPLPRAAQTAELAARALGLNAKEEPMLAPGFDATKLSVLLQEYANRDIMLVGHEPDFSNAVETLTGGAVVMATAGIAAVDIYDVTALDGELVWLLTPGLLR